MGGFREGRAWLTFSTHTEISLLIHLADPQSRPVVITIFARDVRTSVCMSVPTFQILAKQFSSENSDRYSRHGGSGREDH